MVDLRRLAERPYWWLDSVLESRWRGANVRIPAAATVLDVGSGGSPHARANVLCDRAPDDGAERHGDPIRLDRPFVAGDVQALPFADDAFDFVICSHVLEHVVDPVRAVAELSRVAPAGYVETPGAQWEKLAGYRFHRWMVSAAPDTLTFRAKRAPLEDEELQLFYDALTGSLGIGRYIWLLRRRAGVYTSLAWSRPLRAVVEGAPRQDVVQAADASGATPPASSSPGPLLNLLTRSDRRARHRTALEPVDVDARLRCPDCRARLRGLGGHDYGCTGCDRQFPAGSSPFPVLLPLG